jgi:hypothetical protein
MVLTDFSAVISTVQDPSLRSGSMHSERSEESLPRLRILGQVETLHFVQGAMRSERSEESLPQPSHVLAKVETLRFAQGANAF